MKLVIIIKKHGPDFFRYVNASVISIVHIPLSHVH